MDKGLPGYLFTSWGGQEIMQNGWGEDLGDLGRQREGVMQIPMSRLWWSNLLPFFFSVRKRKRDMYSMTVEILISDRN